MFMAFFAGLLGLTAELWFFILFGGVLLLGSWTYSEDNVGWDTVLLLGLIAVPFLVINISFHSITLWGIGMAVLAYAGAGIGWSFVKWILSLREMAVQLGLIINKRFPTQTILDAILAIAKEGTNLNSAYSWRREGVVFTSLTNSIEGIDVSATSDLWNRFVNDIEDLEKRLPLFTEFRSPLWSFIPTFAKNRELILSWAFFWPFSILDFLLHDFLHKLIQIPIDACKKTYDKLSEAMFKGLPK